MLLFFQSTVSCYVRTSCSLATIDAPSHQSSEHEVFYDKSSPMLAPRHTANIKDGLRSAGLEGDTDAYQRTFSVSSLQMFTRAMGNFQFEHFSDVFNFPTKTSPDWLWMWEPECVNQNKSDSSVNRLRPWSDPQVNLDVAGPASSTAELRRPSHFSDVKVG